MRKALHRVDFAIAWADRAWWMLRRAGFDRAALPDRDGILAAIIDPMPAAYERGDISLCEHPGLAPPATGFGPPCRRPHDPASATPAVDA